MSSPAGAVPPGQATPSRAPGDRAKALTAWVVFLTTFVGLIAAIIGLFHANNEKRAATDTVSSQSQTIANNDQVLASLTQANHALASDKAALEQSNSVLSSQLSAATTTANIISSGAAAPKTGTPRRHGRLDIAYNSSADLDSPPSDSQWSTGEADITYFAGQIEVGDGVTSLVLGPKPASYSTCDVSGYGTPYLERASLDVGSWLCFKTGEGRFVAAQIVAWTADMLGLDVTTFE